MRGERQAPRAGAYITIVLICRRLSRKDADAVPSKREKEQLLIDQNRPLMDACSEVAHDLYLAERAKAIYLWVADHAEAVNKASFGKFFRLLQDFALTEMFLCVGRAFDDARFGDTVCIKRVLNMMANANLIDRDRFLQFLPKEWESLAQLEDKALLQHGLQIISTSRPTAKNCAELKRVLEIRHTRVAHRSATSAGEGGATFEDVDHCLDWAKEFIGMVGKAFGNHIFKYDDGTFWSEYDIKSSVMSIRRLTHKAGIVIDPGFAETERLMAAFSKA